MSVRLDAETSRRIHAAVETSNQTDAIIKQLNVLSEVLLGVLNGTIDRADKKEIRQYGEIAFSEVKRLREVGRSLKNMDPIPADYADDKHWEKPQPVNEVGPT